MMILLFCTANNLALADVEEVEEKDSVQQGTEVEQD
jgi:hypothetical protein